MVPMLVVACSVISVQVNDAAPPRDAMARASGTIHWSARCGPNVP